jgi:hypothetical protein
VVPFGGISEGGFLVLFQIVLITRALMLGAESIFSIYKKGWGELVA